MSYQQIIKDIRQKNYQPIYFLHGAEPYFIDAISTVLEKEVLDESEKAFNQIVLYGKEVDFKQVMDHARQFPMMAPYRVVILKEAQEMRSLAQLESYALQPSPQTILVVCHKYKKLDKRTKFAKTLGKTALLFESKKLYDNKIPEWIRSEVARLGLTIKPDALQLIAEYLGSDLSRIVNELNKLAISTTKGGEISAADVQENIGISKDYNVFELQKAIGQKNPLRIGRILNYFEENPKNHPIQMVVGSLYQYLIKLLITKSNPGLNDFQLQAELKLASSYFAKDYKMAVKNYSMDQIQNMVQALRKADHNSKGIGSKNLKSGAIYKEFLSEVLFG